MQGISGNRQPCSTNHPNMPCMICRIPKQGIPQMSWAELGTAGLWWDGAWRRQAERSGADGAKQVGQGMTSRFEFQNGKHPAYTYVRGHEEICSDMPCVRKHQRQVSDGPLASIQERRATDVPDDIPRVNRSHAIPWVNRSLFSPFGLHRICFMETVCFLFRARRRFPTVEIAASGMIW